MSVPISIQKSEAGANTPSLAWNVPGDWYDFVDTPTENWESVTDFIEGELITSSGHQISKLGKTRDDIGGDFMVVKREYSHHSSLGDEPKHFSIHHDYGNPYYADPMAHGGTHHYFVPHAAVEHVASWSSAFDFGVEYSSEFEMDALGTTAVARSIPTNPLFNAAAFIGELREGIPKLGIETWKSRSAVARNAGSDYLNAEFGWKPLVSDIQKFAYVVKNADRIAAQYAADSGKLIKRKYNFPPEEVSSHDEWTGRYPAPLWDYDLFRPDHVGRLRRYRTKRTKRWLKAAFTYYLPPVGTRARDLAIANKLYGIRLTPDVVWQLSPWSWAADWVTNIGDITSNISAFASDGLVMPYAYMMEETTAREEWILDQVAYKSYPGMQNFRQTFTTTAKQRRRATPFGFGFDFGGLTGRQTAILAALSISRRK